MKPSNDPRGRGAEMSARWCAALLLFAWPALAQQRQPGATDPGTAAVEGTAVDTVTSRPVGRVEVTLKGQARQGGARVDLSLVTDEGGHFAFRGLMAGYYGLEGKRAGYRRNDARQNVSLEPGERKKVEIPLAPLGIVSGRVTDEDGAPVAGCRAQAWQPVFEEGRRRLKERGSFGPTKEAGQYRMELDRGRYYIFASCLHPPMAGSDPRQQRLEIVPQFYPGVPELDGATRVAVVPGAEVQGIDFRMRRALPVAVTGRVDATDPSILMRKIQIALRPPRPEFDGGPTEQFPALNKDRAFRITVTPGSYLLVARTSDEGPVCTAQQLLEIADTQPDPVRLLLAPSPDVSGTLEVEGENAPPVEGFQVSLYPIDSSLGGSQTQAQVNQDGAFTLHAVVPGPWRLSVSGEAYVKSLTIGGTEASPHGFDVGSGGAGPLKIVLSTKTGEVKAAASPSSPDEQDRVTFVLATAGLETPGSGPERTMIGDRDGVTFQGVAPGRYYLFAFKGAGGWSLQPQPEVLKAIEGRARLVEVGEGETVEATADPIEADQLKDALKEAQ